MNLPLLHALRPVLNCWLGGFEAEGCDSEIDDLTSEWRARLWPGDLALYFPQDDNGRTLNGVKLVQVSNVDSWKGVCDITHFEPDATGWPGAGQTEGEHILRLDSCVKGSFWDWSPVTEESVPLSHLRPHDPSGGRSASHGQLGKLIRVGTNKMDPDIKEHLQRHAVMHAHCPQGHPMTPSQPSRKSSWGLQLSSNVTVCAICSSEMEAKEPGVECQQCSFHLCGACDRKGLFRGYYSLGCINPSCARQLIEDPKWVLYKARRYLSAAGVPPQGRSLPIELWQSKLAPRLFGDLGLDIPSKVELIELFRRCGEAAGGQIDWKRGLGENQFTDLLFELLTLRASVVTL